MYYVNKIYCILYMSVKPMSDSARLAEVHSLTASIRRLNNKLSDASTASEIKHTAELIEMLRRDLQENLSLIQKDTTKLRQQLLQANILDRVQAGRDHQDSVSRTESRRVPFLSWSRDLRRVAPDPSGRLRRKRTRKGSRRKRRPTRRV